MPHVDSALNRRDFLRAGALGAAAVAAPGLLTPAAQPRPTACIFLWLTGGPSQLETWDPKPDAPSEIRGPFGAIRTRVPGVLLGEHFPRTASLLDRVTVVRSLHHDAAPIHETGHQLMQCGRLHTLDVEHPHLGAVLSHQSRQATWAILGGPVGSTGVNLSHGQTAGYLGDGHAPAHLDATPEADRHAGEYPEHPFGQACLRARQLVEGGTRFVTVNMFNRLYDTLSWDCHADDGVLPTTLTDYGSVLCPLLDRAYSALLLDLEARGLLESTLVVAAGEMGRTPRINLRGGRDHWTGAWSALLAGGGLTGGQVIGATDAHAGEVIDRPVTPGQLLASVARQLGLPADHAIPGPDGRPLRIMTEDAIRELLC